MSVIVPVADTPFLQRDNKKGVGKMSEWKKQPAKKQELDDDQLEQVSGGIAIQMSER